MHCKKSINFTPKIQTSKLNVERLNWTFYLELKKVSRVQSWVNNLRPAMTYICYLYPTQQQHTQTSTQKMYTDRNYSRADSQISKPMTPQKVRIG